VNTPEQIADAALTAMREGLRLFGSYHYFDKGPEETVDLPVITEPMREAGPDTTIAALKLLLVPGPESQERETSLSGPW
jgi:hypothetical protein